MPHRRTYAEGGESEEWGAEAAMEYAGAVFTCLSRVATFYL